MKTVLCTGLAAIAIFATVDLALAAKPGKAARSEQRASARMLGRFDANRDGSLDTSEAQRVRQAFAALKSLDSDKNGELSDSEITAGKVAKRKGKGGKRKG